MRFTLTVGDEIAVDGIRYTVTALTDFGSPCLTAHKVETPEVTLTIIKLAEAVT